MLKNKIKEIILKAIKTLQKEGVLSDFEIPEIIIEYPREKKYGDYSTNIALTLSKISGKKPMEIAEDIKKAIGNKSIFSKVESVNPGFLNFSVSPKYLQDCLKEILKQKSEFGSIDVGKQEKVNVEFISANPTGPLTLGNGRGGFCGDVLSNVLSKAGYKVTREYYINDRGEQIVKLGHSVLKDESAVYQGGYIDSLNKRLGRGDPEEIGEEAAGIILKEIIRPSVQKMGVRFDVWFSEKSLYDKGQVDKAVNDLKIKGFTYESEGAIWFKSQELEDDKDRVLIRKDGIRTYFASDIAYLENKFQRGFKKLILFLGADHHGYIARLKAGAHALGFNKDNIEVVVEQLVRLLKDGQEVRMSKRTGTYVTLDELIDEVGLDVTRFFFLTKSSNTHFDFDLNLAKERSQKNPVFHVQYAHARICSILKKANFFLRIKRPDFKLLKEPEELNLIRQIIKLPEVIEDVVKDHQIQRVAQYSQEIADAFHQFYEKCRVISKDKKQSATRLKLVLATKIVLKNTLSLMGISSPEKM